jgi:hypothetical protein
MPIGAFKLNGIARYLVPSAPAGRTALTIVGYNGVTVSSLQSKFGGSSMRLVTTSSGSYIIATGSTSSLALGTANFTVEFWWYASSYPATNKRWVDFGYQGGTRPLLFTGNSNTRQLVWYVGTGGGSVTQVCATGTTDLPAAGSWCHVAVVRNSGTTKIYINGVEKATGTDNNNYTFSGELWMGASPSLIQAGFNGYIDEVRISNSARYTAGFTPSTTAFVNDSATLLLLHCGGANGGTQFIDDTGSRLPINVDEIFGGELDTAQTQFGSASWYQDAEFDGFTITDESTIKNIGTGNYTIECWVRRQDNPSKTQATIFDFVSGISKLFYNESTNQLTFSTQSTNRITGGSLSLNTWTHVAITRSSGTVSLYINGTQSGSSYSSDTGDFNNITQVLIGCDSNGLNSWVGHIDELRISNIARYTGNFTAPTAEFTNDANTLMLFHMNGTDATTIILDDNS